MIQISIIIPTYKPGNYLDECLESIQNQDMDKKAFEVLVILNGEKEPFYDDLMKKSKQMDNLSIYHLSEAGVSNARNYGMSIAKGDFFVFIDDDDLISTNYLSNLLNQSHEDRIVISNTEIFTDTILDSSLDYISRSFLKNSRADKINIISLKSCLVTVWGKLIPKKVVGGAKFSPKFAKGEDHLFIAQISKRIKGFDLSSSDTLYYRRIRENSATRNITNIKKEWQIFSSLFFAYIGVYLSSPFRYNSIFFVLRELAMVKAITLITKTYLRNKKKLNDKKV